MEEFSRHEEIARLEHEIVRLRAETERLVAHKVSLLAQMPPPEIDSQMPAATNTSIQSTNGGARIALTLGAITLIASIASFTGFIWPQLNFGFRAVILVTLVAVLSLGAVRTKLRLPGFAQALAAVSGVSTVLIAAWLYGTGSLDPTNLGFGLAFALAAIAVGIGAITVRFESWLIISAAASALASLLITSSVSMHYVAAVVLALLLGVVAKISRLKHFVWVCALQCGVALVLLSDATHNIGVGYALPYALFFVAAAYAPAKHFLKTPAGVPEIPSHASSVNLNPYSVAIRSAATLNLALAACVTVFLWWQAVVSQPSIVMHVDATVAMLAAALFIKQRSMLLQQYLTRHTSDLALSAVVLAVVGLTANLSPIWLIASSALLLVLGSHANVSTVAACAVALTAGALAQSTLIKGDSPPWLVLTVAATIAAWSVHKSRKSRLAVLGAVLGLLALSASSFHTNIDVLFLSRAEQYGLLAAVVLLLFFMLGKMRGAQTVLSWWLAPALFAALLPATVRSIAPDDSYTLLRTAIVLALSLTIFARAVTLRLGGLLLPSATCIVLFAAYWTLDVATIAPVWVPLVLCAVVLLALGARFEKVLAPTKKLASWVKSLK